MEFGVFNLGLWHESQSQSEVIYNAVADSVLADELGFDRVWFGEHHFSRHGVFGNTMTLAANVAAETSRARIGTAVVVLPTHSPIRVAEEVALVDVLSHGRVDLGVGAGYQLREFQGLGVDMREARERFSESLDILIAAWTSENLGFNGKFQSWAAEDEYMVLPKPFQQPHPPLFIAVTASPESIALAAGRGLQILVGGPTDIMGIAPQVVERWQALMRENGHDPTGLTTPCLKGVYVAPTDEEAAADVAAVDQYWDLKLLSQIGSPISPDGEIPPGYEHWSMRQKDRVDTIKANTTSGSATLIGSPETVAKRIAELQDAGIDSIFGQFGLPGMPQKNIRRAIELFAREVIPAVPSGRTV